MTPSNTMTASWRLGRLTQPALSAAAAWRAQGDQVIKRGLDLRLLWATVPAVVLGRGAY